MRKLFICVPAVCVGLAGTASLQAAYAPNLNSMQASKMWSISGTLRGFYDDNYTTTPGTAQFPKHSSYGFEVSPSLSLNVPLQQTEIGLRYTYGLYYYQYRMDNGGRPIDQTHQADLWVSHAFSERWQTKVQDVFAVGQEPALLNPNVPQRASGDNIHNNGSISLDTQWTPLLGTDIRYQNNLYHYQNSAYQGLLDLIQHDIALNVNWTLQRTLVAFVGYQFEQVNYTGNEKLGTTAGITSYSDNRDSRSQIVYLGAQYNPLENLILSGKAGIQYADYYNPAAGLSSSTSLSPYADLSATYTYLPGSYVQLGFTQTRNSTDLAAISGNGQITLDQESSIVYAALNHQITPRITANVTGKIQYSTYNAGSYNNQSQTWYSLGLNLAYSINQHVSAEIGYNFDDLTSGVPNQKYKRNRVYLGLAATY